ncbi:MAG: transketolase [Bacilli bacterium]
MDDRKIINAIKALSIAEINKAKSGHVGITLGAAPILYTLYSRHMNIDTSNEKWINRDRFIMSAGHGSALLYATLYMSGFELTINDLKNFRQLGSKTPGHPDVHKTPGVDMSTGLLGQGFASAVGIASAEKYLSENFNNLFNYYTYVLCSDGDLMEGISYEASSLAATLKLGKLIVLYDSNDVCLDGKLTETFNENVLKRFDAMGWHTQYVQDGDNPLLIDVAISKAKSIINKPSIIEIKTIIGKGSLLEGTNKIHGSNLTNNDIKQLKNKLDINESSFSHISVYKKEMSTFIKDRNAHQNKNWEIKYKAYLNTTSSKNSNFLNSFMNKQKYDVKQMVKDLTFENESLCLNNQKIMEAIAKNCLSFLGGSADVSTSTKTYLTGFENFNNKNYAGRNINFGVRESLMGAFINGLSISGLTPFAATFLSFADHLKPSIRMASLMNLPSVYIFTHDSLTVAEDGPTHQPIEQLAMLRSIPNHYTYRPSDSKELIGCWQNILNSRKPSSLIISKNLCKEKESTNISEVKNGAYIVKKEVKRLCGIIIATGLEVDVALEVSNELMKKGYDLRIVSMPCMDLFEEQSEKYRQDILPIGYKTFVIERLSSFGWEKYVYNNKYLITMDEFGMSGKKDDILKERKLDVDSIIKRVEKLLK